MSHQGATIKTPEEMLLMREAGRIVGLAHEAMHAALRPGISTGELDDIAAQVLREHGATPAFLGVKKQNAPDFPATITASVNEELIHGIPRKDRILKEGDVIGLDCGCFYQGFVGDAARTWAVGEVSPAVQRLIDVTRDALYASIDQARAGNRVSDIARTTQAYVKKHGYSVALEYSGHGVGRSMWEDPSVPNWWPKRPSPRQRQEDLVLQPGMTIAIEPMVIAGRNTVIELADGWTVVSADGSLCAHWEHTVAITDGDPLILTVP